MIAHVFADPPIVCDTTATGLVIRTYRTPGDVAKALACLHWSASTAAVVDLQLHGLLGRDVVTYIASRHPMVGLWGITGLCPRDWPAWATERCRRVLARDAAAAFFRGLGDELVVGERA